MRDVTDRFVRPVIPVFPAEKDTKFTAHFEELLKQDGIKLKRTAVRAPNQNAYAERFVQTIQQECLDHFVVLEKEHLRYLVREFVEHYNKERPHQNKGNLPLGMEKPPEASDQLSDVVFDERLGGVLKHYHRKAA